MCILFVKIEKNPKPGEYKLILIANRDEYYKRPTRIAHFWDDNEDIVGGRDMEPGREGGTWLAMNKSGKIGILINMMSDRANNSGKLGRGFLVNNFLNSGRSINGVDFGKRLAQKEGDLGAVFSPFNLVTIDLKTESNVPMVSYLSNGNSDGPGILADSNNAFAFGNSPVESPFQKVVHGKKEFLKLLEKSHSKDELLEGLLDILKSSESHLPDDNLASLVPEYSKNYIQNLGARFVKIPQIMYGSRTHTIILVDSSDKVEYHEWTMEEPILNIDEPNWVHTKLTFDLNF